MTQEVQAAIEILKALGLPRAQQNERTALALLALLNVTPGKAWKNAGNPLIGITPIMEFVATNFGKVWKPNTRETVRRQSIHQLVDAGIALYNPDNPKRPVNSPKAVYQITQPTLALLRQYGTKAWAKSLSQYLQERETLVAQYAKERNMQKVPVLIHDGTRIELTPGEHSELIRAIVEDFAERFAPGAELIYVGDTGKKWGYFNKERLAALGVTVDSHGKMPDVILFYPAKGWLLLIEAVTSHGPVDGKRHAELAKLFAASSAGLVYVTAFPSRAIMAPDLQKIAWETEVWCADAPSHLIHFNGARFLGPYA